MDGVFMKPLSVLCIKDSQESSSPTGGRVDQGMTEATMEGKWKEGWNGRTEGFRDGKSQGWRMRETGPPARREGHSQQGGLESRRAGDMSHKLRDAQLGHLVNPKTVLHLLSACFNTENPTKKTWCQLVMVEYNELLDSSYLSCHNACTCLHFLLFILPHVVSSSNLSHVVILIWHIDKSHPSLWGSNCEPDSGRSTSQQTIRHKTDGQRRDRRHKQAD